jgi:type IV pilus assembly protein PilV
MHAPHTHTQKLAGFTLIEVLVTIVILSVGLLGMAALQITGVRSATGATSRTQATLLADDIVERMRANITAVDADLFAAVDSTAINCAAMPNPYCEEYFDGSINIDAASCTPAQMAAYDINVWFCGVASSGMRRGGLANSLASATATITCSDLDAAAVGQDAEACTNRSPHVVTIGWTENNPQNDAAGTATTTQSISMTIQL